MFNYVDEILAAFNKAEPKGGGTKSSAVRASLFKVGESCEKLKQDKAVEFHNLMANILYATKRAGPDTCTTIAFLTTRVQAPDKDDWTKLVHLMRYIRGTHTMSLILSAIGSGILKWWVEASFAVHPNMRKLVHLMRYIRGTRTMSLILSANGSDILKWWVESSFAVHPNMRGLGRRTVFGTSISHSQLHQAEAQYSKLYKDQDCGR
jgi:hypothetical protein